MVSRIVRSSESVNAPIRIDLSFVIDFHSISDINFGSHLPHILFEVIFNNI